MISCATGGLALHFLGVRIFCFLGKGCIYVFSELCESCVIYKSGDVWVPCWCFTVVRGGAK